MAHMDCIAVLSLVHCELPVASFHGHAPDVNLAHFFSGTRVCSRAESDMIDKRMVNRMELQNRPALQKKCMIIFVIQNCNLYFT